ncbi:hypothetical protein BU16DRAFT_567113 [Lophium mytilinum]|uniref:Uncharacterized protein n=1 Tax=Lophium mytilinum TaxID=390894 RepID=A0A6A6QCM6_9PEZI|nr:hypothetical protein BU16DRAFT_567113 [Lophium mytilinum]
MTLLERSYSISLLLLALTFSILLIELFPAPDPVASAERQATSTGTSSSSSTGTPTNLPVYLYISSAPPDPLGVSKVSGFYGPGAWAAWMLWVVGSWYRVFTEKRSKLDSNTLGFVIATNYAALDLIRRIQQVRHAVRLENQAADEIMAQYGAAMTIVWQGSMHTLLQSLIFGIYFHERRKIKFWTLSGGLVIPLLSQAMASAASIQIKALDDKTPAMFWNGMGPTAHSVLLYINWIWLPVFMLVLLLIGIYLHRLYNISNYII